MVSFFCGDFACIRIYDRIRENLLQNGNHFMKRQEWHVSSVIKRYCIGIGNIEFESCELRIRKGKGSGRARKRRA